MSQISVLVVEDEPAIAETLIYSLETDGFAVTHAGTGTEAIEQFRNKAHDFLILDVGLPDITGFDVCRGIRKTSNVPLLFLTARESEIDRVVGLELGGDDYVTKPFSPRELTARIQAILRRTRSANPLPSNPPRMPPRSDSDEFRFTQTATKHNAMAEISNCRATSSGCCGFS